MIGSNFGIFIGDYVSYNEIDRVVGSNSFKIVGYDKNSMGGRIMVLNKPITIKEYSGIERTYTSIHPCYLQLSEKGIRMRKLKKINGTSD